MATQTQQTEDEKLAAELAAADLNAVPEGGADDQGSKLKQLLGILKRTMGVSDLASLRLSLPANLLHPAPNLDYWNYLDRPDLFATIGDNDDELERMKAVLRWSFSKDLHFAKGKVCKPYNSVLGEQFRALWDVEPASLDSDGITIIFREGLDPDPKNSSPATAPTSRPGSSASSIKSIPSPRQAPYKTSSAASSGSSIATFRTAENENEEDTPATSLAPTEPTVQEEPLEKPNQKSRVIFLNEQVSHHPPVSTFWYESVPSASQKQRVQAYGVDQMSAKFTGTSVKVYAGSQNKGIFVSLPDRNDEEYNITHPTASITGLLRGSPYITISDFSYVTCLSPSGKNAKGTKALRAIVNYADESWLGKAKFAVEGVVYEYEIGTESENYTKIKQVPEKSIKGWLEGSWRGQVTWRTSAKDKSKAQILLDMNLILPIPKIVRPLTSQGPYESRRLWQQVTASLLSKKFNAATKHKQAIEQTQRDLAAERTKTGKLHEVCLFDDAARLEADDGRSRLSEQGRKALQRELEGRGYLAVEGELVESSPVE